MDEARNHQHWPSLEKDDAGLLNELQQLADGDSDEILQRAGLERRAEELNLRASELGKLGSGKSAIYEAWVRYARQYPESVFGL